MSDEFEDEDTDDDESGSNLVKDLRRQLKAQKKANDEALTELRSFRTEQRKSTVAKLIESAGGNPAYAEFYNGEDSSEGAVKAWIESRSQLLGITAPDEPDAQADDVRKVTFAAANAPATKLGSKDDLAQNLATARTREELDAATDAIFRSARG